MHLKTSNIYFASSTQLQKRLALSLSLSLRYSGFLKSLYLWWQENENICYDQNIRTGLHLAPGNVRLDCYSTPPILYWGGQLLIKIHKTINHSSIKLSCVSLPVSTSVSDSICAIKFKEWSLEKGHILIKTWQCFHYHIKRGRDRSSTLYICSN